MSYKYIYLEQTVYLLSNKVNKLEIEFNNPNVYNNSNSNSNSNSLNSALDSAEIIMNEIFNDGFCSKNSCQFTSSTSISPDSPASPSIPITPTVPIFPILLFLLLKIIIIKKFKKILFKLLMKYLI